jgi:DNA polymerase III epsilon subunit family exonuclease
VSWIIFTAIFLVVVGVAKKNGDKAKNKAASSHPASINKQKHDTQAHESESAATNRYQSELASKPKRREEPMRTANTTFIVFDLETTGLSPHTCEIIEIAAIGYTIGNGNEFTAINTLVKPTKKITKRITTLTGITNELLAEEGEDLRSALKDFLTFAGNAVLVAHNAKFDMAFIHAACEKVGLPSPTNRVLCTLTMAREKWPGQPSYKLTELTRNMTVQSHRALGDAQRALTLFATIHTNKP